MKKQGVTLTHVGVLCDHNFLYTKGVYKVASHYSVVLWFVVLLSGSL